MRLRAEEAAVRVLVVVRLRVNFMAGGLLASSGLDIMNVRLLVMIKSLGVFYSSVCVWPLGKRKGGRRKGEEGRGEEEALFLHKGNWHI